VEGKNTPSPYPLPTGERDSFAFLPHKGEDVRGGRKNSPSHIESENQFPSHRKRIKEE